MPETPREPPHRRHDLPNVRGEDENELQYMTGMIENLSWQLSPSPSKAPTVLLGRHPKPPSASSTFCAAVYCMGKQGGKSLEVGPEMGACRKEALRRLLDVVEGEVGRMVIRDARVRDRERVVGMGKVGEGERRRVGGEG